MFSVRYRNRYSPMERSKNFQDPLALHEWVKFNIDTIEIIEEWKWVKGYENEYKVSNLGKVKSYKRKKSSLLNPRPTRSGYLRLDLYSKKANPNSPRFRYSPLVHVLVASHFCYNAEPDVLDEVDHINGYCDDNPFWNLRWADREMQIENRNFDRSVPF